MERRNEVAKGQALAGHVAAWALFLGVFASPAGAQRVLDWPLRTGAGPETVVRGVEAVFWNPGAISARAGRGELLVVDQRTPDVIGVSGFAAGAVWRLDTRTTVAAGYQHVGIDDIGETSTSPLPDAGEATFSVAEDQLTAGMSHALGSALNVGAGVRYDRSNESGFYQNATTLNAGLLLQPTHALRPVLGASIATQDGGARYAVGVAAGHAIQGLELRAGYGLRGGGHAPEIEHRIGITGSWRELVAVSGGIASASAGSERTWEPILGASLHVSRYELGVLREALSNDFGSAYSFRFRIGLR